MEWKFPSEPCSICCKIWNRIWWEIRLNGFVLYWAPALPEHPASPPARIWSTNGMSTYANGIPQRNMKDGKGKWVSTQSRTSMRTTATTTRSALRKTKRMAPRLFGMWRRKRNQVRDIWRSPMSWRRRRIILSLRPILINWWRPPFFVIQPKSRGSSARQENSNIWIWMRTTPKF